MNPLNVLRDSWFFFSRNLGAIARLCLPLVLLECLVKQVLTTWVTDQYLAVSEVLTGLLFYPFYTAALILFLDARSRSLQPRILDLLAAALRLWPALAVLAALSTLLIMLGASLLVLPGLWVMVKLAFSEYLLVLRGLPPLAALRGSFMLSSGHFWSILACVLGVMAPLWLLDGWSYRQLGEHPELLPALLLDCANGFLQLFATVVMFRLFMLASEPAAEA